MTYSWKGKVVLITGAASGIGAKVVRLLLQEDAQYVAVLDIDEAVGTAFQNELNSKHGANKVKFFKCDVTNDDQLFGAFKAVKEDKGYIDVVINNAGIMNDGLNVYKKQIEINVTALVTSSLKALELMRKDKGGKGGTIVNIASTAGLCKEWILPIYWATKSAVIQFSNCLGHETFYAKTRVRLVTLCFGSTDTPLFSKQKLGSFDEESNESLMAEVSAFPKQSPDSAAKGLIEAFKRGETGSVWLVTADRPALDITDRYNSLYDGLRELIYQ